MEGYVRQPEMSGEAAETTARGRKRNLVLQESEQSMSSVQLKTRRRASLDVTGSPEDSTSPASSGNLTLVNDNTWASCCSSSRSNEQAKGNPEFTDLKENTVNVEYLATSSAGHSVNFRDRSEQMIPSSEVQVESGELESPTRLPESNSRRPEKMPTEDELEDFFAAAEKSLQKQFIDKYNFDISKEEPLEGRYEWVPVQVKP